MNVPKIDGSSEGLFPVITNEQYLNQAVEFENETGRNYNLLNAIENYTIVANQGSQQAKESLKRLFDSIELRKYLFTDSPCRRKKELKILMRMRIVFLRAHYPNNYINIPISEDNTALHLSAKGMRFMDCARLLCLGADSALKNNKQETAFSGLCGVEKMKITRLRNNLSLLIKELKKSAPKVLENRISIRNRDCLTANISQKFSSEGIPVWLSELYKNPDIAPLMDLAKLAALGLHDLSERKILESDYDSDDDDNSKINSLNDSQKLSICFDGERKTVEGIYHFGQDGLDGKQAWGAYPLKENAIYIGAKSDNARGFQDILGTFIHELTHFLALEVFHNDCNPYFNNVYDKNKFENLTNKVKAQKSQTDSLIQSVFNNYKPSEFHWELIVRVPQIIVANMNNQSLLIGNGYQHLEKIPELKELLSYYRYHFLPFVKAHTKNCLDRTLKLWPIEPFIEKNT